LITHEERLRKEYIGRVERAIDYIYAHYGEDLTLDTLADVAAFSRFHFHRVFSGIAGETVSDFLKRVRLQHAASRLAENPDESITEISLDSGFSSPSVFARFFKAHFGVTASEWRKLGRSVRRNLIQSTISQARGNHGQSASKPGQAPGSGNAYALAILGYEGRSMQMSKLKYTVEVKELPELTVAYTRHIGAYNTIGEAFERLGRWAGPRGLYAVPGVKSLAIYHDSPETTIEKNLRSSACVTVARGTEVSGEFNLMDIPGGRFAVARFEILPDQFGEAWDALMGEWFPSSGYQPDDRMCYEVYLAEPENHPEGKFIIEICEPVRPL